MPGYCDHGHEQSGFKRARAFLVQLSDYQDFQRETSSLEASYRSRVVIEENHDEAQ